MNLRQVEKRDGRLVPFDEEKIRLAILAAMAAVGEDDPAFAGEVAGIVRMTLERREEVAGAPPTSAGRGPENARGGAAGTTPRAPSIEQIQDLVETALIELGRARVAKAYILYRDRRSRAREALKVDEPAPRRRGPRVQESEGSAPWSKGRIAAALVHEAELSRPLAEEVATQVEARVLAAGFHSISTGLIREMVDNELVERGLEGALRRQGTVGLARSDLRRLIARGPSSAARPGAAPAPTSAAERVGGEILRRFALEEILDELSAERHRAGDLHVIDLERPQLHLLCALPSELLLRGEPSPEAAFELLDELVAGAQGSSRGAVLEDPARALQPLIRGRSSAGLGAWLRALGAAARASGKQLDLGPPGTRSPAFTQRLVEELAELPVGLSSPRLFLDEPELDALLDDNPRIEAARVLESLAASGRLVPTWSSRQERTVGPGCRRAPRERGAVSCGGAVALNLARLARRAGPWREDRMLELSLELVEGATDALSRLALFQESHRAARAAGVRGRVMYAVTPVGLREALQILGDGEVRPEQGARILGLLADATRRCAADRRMSVVLSPWFADRSPARFTALDHRRFPHAQRLLFDGGGEPSSDRDRPYSEGFDLGSSRSRGPGEDLGRLLSTVPSGALYPPLRTSGPGGGGGGDLLRAWSGFRRLRAGPEGAEPIPVGPPAATMLSPTLFQPESEGPPADGDA